MGETLYDIFVDYDFVATVGAKYLNTIVAIVANDTCENAKASCYDKGSHTIEIRVHGDEDEDEDNDETDEGDE